MKARRYLLEAGYRYNPESILQSEMRVLKTLDFKLATASPLLFVEILLEILGIHLSLMIYWFSESFLLSFLPSFLPSFIHSFFVHSFIHCTTPFTSLISSPSGISFSISLLLTFTPLDCAVLYHHLSYLDITRYVTSLNDTVAKSSANGLEGTRFTSCYWLQLRTDF